MLAYWSSSSSLCCVSLYSILYGTMSLKETVRYQHRPGRSPFAVCVPFSVSFPVVLTLFSVGRPPSVSHCCIRTFDEYCNHACHHTIIAFSFIALSLKRPPSDGSYYSLPQMSATGLAPDYHSFVYTVHTDVIVFKVYSRVVAPSTRSCFGYYFCFLPHGLLYRTGYLYYITGYIHRYPWTLSYHRLIRSTRCIGRLCSCHFVWLRTPSS